MKTWRLGSSLLIPTLRSCWLVIDFSSSWVMRHVPSPCDRDEMIKNSPSTFDVHEMNKTNTLLLCGMKGQAAQMTPRTLCHEQTAVNKRNGSDTHFSSTCTVKNKTKSGATPTVRTTRTEPILQALFKSAMVLLGYDCWCSRPVRYNERLLRATLLTSPITDAN